MGTGISARFAAEGAQVVVADVNEAGANDTVAQITGNGGQAIPSVFDLTDAEACQAAVGEVGSRFGRIDVLVNNAGINRRGPLLELSEDDWRATFAVNLDSMFHMCRAVLPMMIDQGGGAIVNTASQWGLHPAPGHIAYNTSKAAVAMFTQCLARDYASSGVRVNGIAPGEVRTPMLESNLARTGRSLEDLNALVPFGRIGEPEEIAALVAFLASDEAAYLCGSVVEITGAQAVS
jgi:NAD(P)-dependent dehydrogenase (short-subunit alcohol dehydrogenase family)